MTNSKTRDLKPHIGIFGRRNVGKSSLINTITGQDVAIVSDVAGTTTDPVKRSVEIPDFAPVVIIDTAGIDDVGMLGDKRIQRTRQVLSQIDLAILLITDNQFGASEEELIAGFVKVEVPYIIIYSKTDISTPEPDLLKRIFDKYHTSVIHFSNHSPENLSEIVEAIKSNIPETVFTMPSLLGDIVSQNDIVLLIMPIDAEAPAGRLILPQMQALRDMLDNHVISIVLQPEEVELFLKNTGIKPKLAITDSQLFYQTDTLVPDSMLLTGFSIVLARYKGDFEAYLKGTPRIDDLKDGNRVLILESCSHHVSCEDIGRTKIPRWMDTYTKKKLSYDVVAGLSNIDRPITEYSIVIQCGGCMITRKQLHSRLRPAIEAGIPVTNYGLAIAYMHGYYDRVVEPFL